MDYRSDKWRALSAPAWKMGPNLLICSCQLCFCVPSDPGQLTGRGTEALQPLSKHDCSFLWTTATQFSEASVVFITLLCPCSLVCSFYTLLSNLEGMCIL